MSSQPASPKVIVLRCGYSNVLPSEVMLANGTCTLIQSEGKNILVDTLGPWDRDILINLLQQQSVTPEAIDVVIGTHGHPDHIGNLNLFTGPDTVHIVGLSHYREDKYRDFSTFPDPFQLTEDVTILKTPGHTLGCISVLVKGVDGLGTVAIAGDLFEKEEDMNDEDVWLDAGSEDPDAQRENRDKILSMADHIIPGHGPIFSTAPYKK